MILPTIRASFSRGDALHLTELLARNDPELREGARRRLEEGGVDTLLDDPRVLNALLTEPGVRARPELVFYVLVRQSLLECGVADAAAADYVASLLVRFGRSRRAYKISDHSEDEYRYLVDMIVKLDGASGRKAFLLRAHIGNFALWISGLFPDFVEARMRRKGAPPISYYESIGSAGYRMAAESPEATALGVDRALASVARHFCGVRGALNRVSDRYLWRGAGDPVGRLLREVASPVSRARGS